MEGIVSLLPEPTWRHVVDLWAELAAEFGVTVQAEPHFSYHLAYHYSDEALAAVADLAATTPPFTVTTSGLGVFGGTALTLFINVVRSPVLSRIHQSLHDAVQPLVADPHPANRYYLPHAWTPHITLGDIPDAVTLGRVMAALGQRDFYWRIPIDNIALLTDRTLPISQLGRWPLAGGLERGEG